MFGVIKRFFARRKLHYLGSIPYRASHYSPIMDARWTTRGRLHLYAAENGRRAIKDSDGNWRVTQLLTYGPELAAWYYDRSHDPFDIDFPIHPSTFLEARRANLTYKV